MYENRIARSFFFVIKRKLPKAVIPETIRKASLRFRCYFIWPILFFLKSYFLIKSISLIRYGRIYSRVKTQRWLCVILFHALPSVTLHIIVDDSFLIKVPNGYCVILISIALGKIRNTCRWKYRGIINVYRPPVDILYILQILFLFVFFFVATQVLCVFKARNTFTIYYINMYKSGTMPLTQKNHVSRRRRYRHKIIRGVFERVKFISYGGGGDGWPRETRQRRFCLFWENST